MKLRKMNNKKIEYRITDLAIRNIKGNIPLMAKLMERFDRGQRTIELMLDAKDKRFTESDVLEIIIEGSGLYREQIIEEDTEVVSK